MTIPRGVASLFVLLSLVLSGCSTDVPGSATATPPTVPAATATSPAPTMATPTPTTTAAAIPDPTTTATQPRKAFTPNQPLDECPGATDKVSITRLQVSSDGFMANGNACVASGHQLILLVKMANGRYQIANPETIDPTGTPANFEISQINTLIPANNDDQTLVIAAGAFVYVSKLINRMTVDGWDKEMLEQHVKIIRTAPLVATTGGE